MERRAIAIRGIVQGVGFRPFVHGLASHLRLTGCVRNQTSGVWIEVEGEPARLDEFLASLQTRHPPLARIETITWKRDTPKGDQHFVIEASDTDQNGAVTICPDIATCADCLQELFDPQDRRYRYAFLNCTNCGPRLTIVKGAPYDRARTSMAAFAMCDACRWEYEHPADRRFHAQPVACPACGPKLSLVITDTSRADLASPQKIDGDDALVAFGAALCDGKIGALKGLGGYHLVCDARSAAAVEELRRRKERDEKPFAVMVRDLEAAQSLCELNEHERRLLSTPRRPIVLLRKRKDLKLAEQVAPGNPFLGLMLPYTPLHHLLLHAVNGIPLVMTSGNRCDEPIAYLDADAFQRLAGIADLFLTHDRPIQVRCDDSVARIMDGRESLVRRSRGYAPEPITVPLAFAEPVLAVGGQLKATFALGRDRQVIVSHHLGDLDHYEAYRAFCRDIDLYQELFAIRPAWLVHDLHPDYASTRYALERLRAEGLQGLGVQHHYAHMAACMADNGLDEPVIGVSFDGTGYGDDGAIWGGEILVGDYGGFERAGHLRYVGLPGGDQAIREPWRVAFSHLLDAGGDPSPFMKRVPADVLRTVGKMLDRKWNTPWTSSAGRLFDAVASLAGLRDRVSFEGQAAMELEWLATGQTPEGAYPFECEQVPADPRPVANQPLGDNKPAWRGDDCWVMDTRPLILAVAKDVAAGVAAARIARRFHSTLVNMIVEMCRKIQQRCGLAAVTLSGGVFMNALLAGETAAALTQHGFRVYRHKLVPPNDGGISLGQAAVAAYRMRTSERRH